MIKLKVQAENKTFRNKRPNYTKSNATQYKRIASMARTSASVINELFNPIDTINRFINLALQGLEEDAQSRQFLIESKLGIRMASSLLKRLNNYTKKIEKEIRKISTNNEYSPPINSKRGQAYTEVTLRDALPLGV